MPYKRLDVAIEACRLARVPLKIVGRGPEEARLRHLAGSDVDFLGWRTDEEIRHLYGGATAVLLPGTEDFGMVPVEAQACGRPVVALARGGALETVVDGVTGVLVQEPSAEAFAEGLARPRAQEGSGSHSHDAERFSALRFRRISRPPLPRPGSPGGRAMMRRYNRLLALFFVATDAIISAVSFALAYVLRFYWLAALVPVTKGLPEFEYYRKLLPFVMVILPIAFHIQGLYHLRRGRSRATFFAVSSAALSRWSSASAARCTTTPTTCRTR